MQLQSAADCYFILQVIPECAGLGHLELLQGFFFFNSSWTPIQTKGSTKCVLVALAAAGLWSSFSQSANTPGLLLGQCQTLTLGNLLNPLDVGELLKTKVRAGFGQLLNPIASQFLGGLGHLKTSHEPNGADGPHGHGLRRQDPVTGPQAETLRLFSVSGGIWKEWSLPQHPQAMPRREGSCWAMDGASLQPELWF